MSVTRKPHSKLAVQFPGFARWWDGSSDVTRDVALGDSMGTFAMFDLFVTPVGMLWLTVAFVAIMAGMPAAAPD
jgi:hypothetical protein